MNTKRLAVPGASVQLLVMIALALSFLWWSGGLSLDFDVRHEVDQTKSLAGKYVTVRTAQTTYNSAQNLMQYNARKMYQSIGVWVRQKPEFALPLPVEDPLAEENPDLP